MADVRLNEIYGGQNDEAADEKSYAACGISPVDACPAMLHIEQAETHRVWQKALCKTLGRCRIFRVNVPDFCDPFCLPQAALAFRHDSARNVQDAMKAMQLLMRAHALATFGRANCAISGYFFSASARA